ncbi:MAG TPA: glutamyl-tRNA reductase [Dehalococcoidia bacterium]|nr:glutamyl-tRNA reductase [Dehalococcoidia bacterium]
MRVCVVGVNHSTTPIAIRERLAISVNQLPEALLSLQEHISQGILLSTCNRTEVYSMDQATGSGQNAAVDFLSTRAKISDAELRPYLYVHRDEAAVRHLFCVASGLDSMVVGEHEILGQVRHALEEAEKTRRIDPPLLNLFRHALRVGRRVRQETGIGRHALSVSSVAVDLATRVVGDLANCQILVVGAGEAGSQVAKAARKKGASQIIVTSRSQERASALARALGGTSVALSDLGEALRTADIVISCTGAPHTILNRRLIEEAMSARPQRPLVVIDIALPRDVEPGVRQMENVHLFDMDDLTQISQLHQQRRRGEIQRAMQIVDAEVAKCLAWWQTLEVEPTVSALVRKAEAIRQAQLDMTLKKLRGLSNEERESLEAMTRAIVKKILHDPIRCLKENGHSNEIYARVVKELFQLDREAPR